MREYLVTITTSHATDVTIAIFAKDRADAIDFVKRNNRARFHRGEYKSVKGAKMRGTTKSEIMREWAEEHGVPVIEIGGNDAPR